MGFRRERGIVPGQIISARTISGFTRSINDLSLSRQNLGREPEGFWAKLSGNSSPYSFQEVVGEITGTAISWTVIAGGLSGTSTAYEMNSASGLDGKSVFLEWSGVVGGFTFEYPRQGVGKTPCPEVAAWVASKHFVDGVTQAKIATNRGTMTLIWNAFSHSFICPSTPAGTHCNYTGSSVVPTHALPVNICVADNLRYVNFQFQFRLPDGFHPQCSWIIYNGIFGCCINNFVTGPLTHLVPTPAPQGSFLSHLGQSSIYSDFEVITGASISIAFTFPSDWQTYVGGLGCPGHLGPDITGGVVVSIA